MKADALHLVATALSKWNAAGEESSRVKRPSAMDLAIASVLLNADESSAIFCDRERFGSAFGYQDPEAAKREIEREAPPNLHPRARGMFLGGPNGAFLTHAAGAGWAFRLRSETSRALAVFDAVLVDAGEFHNGVNFAGVTRARTTFVAITTKRNELHDIGAAYGIDETTQIITRASDLLAGMSHPEGPTFVTMDISAIAHLSLDTLSNELAAPNARASV